jgi:hypothetical protein
VILVPLASYIFSLDVGVLEMLPTSADGTNRQLKGAQSAILVISIVCPP